MRERGPPPSGCTTITYRGLLEGRYRRHVSAPALLIEPLSEAQSCGVYSLEGYGTRVKCEFPMFKLYEEDKEALKVSDNPRLGAPGGTQGVEEPKQRAVEQPARHGHHQQHQTSKITRSARTISHGHSYPYLCSFPRPFIHLIIKTLSQPRKTRQRPSGFATHPHVSASRSWIQRPEPNSPGSASTAKTASPSFA